MLFLLLVFFYLGTVQKVKSACTGCSTDTSCVEMQANAVYGCHGTFSGGMSSTSASAICASGYTICPNASRVLQLFNNVASVGYSAVTSTNEFYATKQSSQGNAICTSTGSNDVWGIASSSTSLYETYQCSGVLNRAIGKSSAYCIASSWCVKSTTTELNDISLNNTLYGGVLCCKVSTPTSNPTSVPTKFPTSVPTSIPTPIPTSNPTPTYENCETELNIFDWTDESSEKYVPNSNIKVSLINNNDNAEIYVSVNVTADYLCQSSSDQFGSETILPVTYVVDTSQFNSYGRDIYNPNSCENRIDTSFSGTWSDFWECSYTPSNANDLGSTNYLSYPPPNIWSISMLSDCGTVSWTKLFTINELAACKNENDEFTFEWSETSSAIVLSGYIYLTLISPLDASDDSHYYNSYNLQKQKIEIDFMKSVYLLSNDAEVQLFGITTIGKYIDDDTVSLIFMTWSTKNVNLKTPQLMYPTEYENELNIYKYASTGDCTFESDYRCYQLWVVNSTISDCSESTTLLDFSSDYLISTLFNCLDDSKDACTDLFDANEESYQINLDYSLFYQTVCNLDVFSISFDGQISWYDNENFDNALSDPIYEVEDTAYVEVYINNIAEYNVLSVSLVNAWLCTSSSDSLTVDQLTGIGGCLSNDVDANSFQIFLEGVAYDVVGAIIDTTDPSTVRFSFTVPSLSRYSFYLQVQVQLELESSSTRRRERRLLTTSSSSSSIQDIQFVSSANAQQSSYNNNNNNGNINKIIIYGCIGGGVFALLLIGFIIGYYKCRNNKSETHDFNMSSLKSDVQTMVEITDTQK